MIIPGDDPRAVAAFEAIHAGDVEGLERLLAEHPTLATARFTDERRHERTLLHTATDWPGHFPRGAATVAALVAAGADTRRPSGGRTPRRRCTGRRAATTSRCSTRWSTPAPTSTRGAR